MRRIRIAALLALVLVLASVAVASAQLPAVQTQFVTAITFQNVGTAQANVVFQFYQQGQATPITVQRPLAAGAGSSLFVGGLTGSEALPANFLGSAVMSSSQPVVATLVQIPQSTTVKVRPLSNGFSNVTSEVLLATVLKNQFNTTSRFSVQNADGARATVSVQLKSTDGTTIDLPAETLPAGAAKYYNMGELSQVSAASFNGSATVTAVREGTSTPANIVGSVVELSTTGVQATAFEGVSGGSTTVNVATALCKVPGTLADTAYAVQNVGDQAADFTVTFQPGGATLTKNIAPSAKASFGACEVNSPGFSGSAKITSSEEMVVIAKAFVVPGTLSTAFLGEATGSDTLALPYVRFTSQANFNAGDAARQQAYIAIQNVGTAAVGPVTLTYRDKNGGQVGVHTIDSIAPGAKANSNATAATGDAAKLLEFGNPESQPDGQGFGGAVIVTGPDGSQLIAVVRVVSNWQGSVIGEDYNGIPIQ